MNDFSKSIIKWVVIGLIILLAIILLTNIINSSKKENTKDVPLMDNSYEGGVEQPNDLDDLDDLDSDSFTDDLPDDDAYYVDAPDTASSSLFINIVGLTITTTGIVYILKNKIRKAN